MQPKQLIEATCPDCRGPMSVSDHEGLKDYRCLVEHVYSARGLLEAHSEAQEKALWAAVVALEEASKLVEAVASELPEDLLQRLRSQARQKRGQALEIRRILEQLDPFQTG